MKLEQFNAIKRSFEMSKENRPMTFHCKSCGGDMCDVVHTPYGRARKCRCCSNVTKWPAKRGAAWFKRQELIDRLVKEYREEQCQSSKFGDGNDASKQSK